MKTNTIETTQARAARFVRSLTDDQILTAYERTTKTATLSDSYIRGWCMDEIERRYPVAFNAWLDLDEPRDEQLRQFVEEIAE